MTEARGCLIPNITLLLFRTLNRNLNLLLGDSRDRKRGEVGLEGLTLNAKLFGNAGQVLWSGP